MRLFKGALSILLLLFLTTPQVFGQQILLENILPGQFKGVGSMGQEGFFVYLMKNQSQSVEKKLDLLLFNPSMESLSINSVNLPKGTAAVNGIYNNSNFLFAIVDPGKKRVSYLTFDDDGESTGMLIHEKQKRSIFKKISLLPKVYPVDEGFIVIDYRRQKTLGYRVRKLDGQLNAIWEFSYYPTKGKKAQIRNVVIDKGIVLIEREIIEKTQIKQLDREVIAHDLKSGVQKFSISLIEQGRRFDPSTFFVKENQDLILAGMYYKSDAFNEENSDGIFFMEIDSKGDLTKNNLIAWEGPLDETLNQSFPLDAWYSTSPKFLFQDIIESGDRFQIVGEAFRRAASGAAYVSHMLETTGPGSNLSTMDFVVLEVGKSDLKIKDAHFVSKEKMTVWVPTDTRSVLSLERYFNEYELFSYRFSTRLEDDLNSIVYYNWGKGKPYIGYAILTDARRINSSKIYLNKEAAEEGSINVLPLDNKELLIFERNKKTKSLKLWKEKIE